MYLSGTMFKKHAITDLAGYFPSSSFSLLKKQFTIFGKYTYFLSF